MADRSKIEWTDATWSPVTGCTKVSDGCKYCYAESIAKRFWKDRKFSDVRIHPERLEQPLHWEKPRMVFVCSMGDLFHDDVPYTDLDSVFNVIAEAKQHTFQILTKRPETMYNYLGNQLIPANCWLGVSAENQATYDQRLPILLRMHSTIRFVSMEPLLDHVDMMLDFHRENQVDWVIVGCESGPKRRPMRWDWVRSIQDQCVAENVPLFIKQGEINCKLVKMPELDGKVWDQYPSPHTVTQRR
jgi:protein gp37